jgi:hypothetical protein
MILKVRSATLIGLMFCEFIVLIFFVIFIFKMYYFNKCMILKVTKPFFHHYFICSEFLKKVLSATALIVRHVQCTCQ